MKKNFKKKLEILVKNFLLTFFVLVCLALIISGLMFYKYGYLNIKKQLNHSSFFKNESIFLDKKKGQEILKILESRQKEFEQIESKRFHDLLPL